MFRRNETRLVAKLMVLIMVMMSVITYLPSGLNPFSESVEAAESYTTNELAKKAVEANYTNYMTGRAIDAAWGNFSGYDYYILSKAGVSFDNWSYEGTSLLSSLNDLIAETINKEKEDYKASAKRVAQDLILAKELNDEARAQLLLAILEERLTATGELDEGTYGIYSNMPTYDLLARENLFEDADLDIDAIVDYILNNQDTTGAWPIADTTLYISNDFITTAEAVRTLSQLKADTSADSGLVQAAIDMGLDWLQSNQTETGGYVAGWDDMVMDTSEMIFTAVVLGVDPSTWTHSSGKSPVDYMMDNAFNGENFGNAASNTWALDAYLQLGATVETSDTLGSYDGLLLTGIRNNYNSYKTGTSISGSWGEFSSYDIYQLVKAGVDVESWSYGNNDLMDSLNTLIDESITNESTDSPSSAKRLAQDFVMASQIEGTTKSALLIEILEDRQVETGEFDTGLYAIYSNMSAFDLILREDGITGSTIDVDGIVNYILSTQDTTGAWPIANADMWISNDFIATNEAVRSLAQLKDSTSVDSETLDEAIESGLAWLKALQQDDGGYVIGWDDKVVDTSSMIYTAKILDVDLETLISNEGNTPIDFMKNTALANGSFGNVASTTLAMDAYLLLGGMVSDDAVISVTVDPNSVQMDEEETQQFVTTVKKVNAANEIITGKSSWTVSDSDKASINSDGLMTAIDNGAVNVIASYQFDVTTSAAISISKKSTDTTTDTSDKTKVYLAVIGKNDEVIYGPKSINISESDTYGQTAMGALDASNLDWTFDDDFDELVNSIEGITNTGMTGWMYSVNGEVPTVLAVNKSIDANDKVIWWFSEDANGGSPDWPSSSSSSSQDSDDESDEFEVIDEGISELSDTYIFNADKQMSQADSKILREVLRLNEVGLAGTFANEDLVLEDEELSILVPGGAHSETLEITAEELEDTEDIKNFGVKINTSVYEFGPDGTSFDEPVVITLTVPVDDELDLEKLTPAWFNEETKLWVSIPFTIDLETGIVTFEIDHFTKFAVVELEKRVSFDDVTATYSWAVDAIEILAGSGVLNGTGDGYEPNRSMTRAEFTKVMVEALELNNEMDLTTEFNDVSQVDWFYDYVQTGAASKLIVGEDDGSFRPNDSITRNEVAVILSRLENDEMVSESGLSFADMAEIPEWAVDGVKFVSENELMVGYEQEFNGNDDITRAEAAVVVYRYLNYQLQK